MINKILINIAILSSLVYGQITWNIDSEMANFGQLVLDYSTYTFEGGYFENTEYQSSYVSEGIPFLIDYVAPSDYGNIKFSYEPNSKVIFHADIWWMGQGEILYPISYESADQFSWDQNPVDAPVSIEYYNFVGEITTEDFETEANAAWQSVQNLSVLKQFAQYPYRVGIYLYAPAVGAFEPSVAKWIIFLYTGGIASGVSNNDIIPANFVLHQNYPNPFNPSTTIAYSLSSAADVELAVFDIIGNQIAILVDDYQSAGEYRTEFNIGKYTDKFHASGIYLYRLTVGNLKQVKKMLLLK